MTYKLVKLTYKLFNLTYNKQVEGGCSEGNRGPSIWDTFANTKGNICDGTNGDIAVDQYHRYKVTIIILRFTNFLSLHYTSLDLGCVCFDSNLINYNLWFIYYAWLRKNL